MNRLPKHVTLKHLNAFVAVAQESSFTRAAERLFQTQSSVTSLVRQLEEALSTLLFARTSRRVLLTAAGEEFLPRVMRLLADFDGAIGDVVRFGALERGRVGVAAAPSAITDHRAGGRLRRAPSRRALYLSDDNSGRIQRKVAAREVDFGLTSRWADAPGWISSRSGRPLRRAVPRGRRRAAPPGRHGALGGPGRPPIGGRGGRDRHHRAAARADLPIEAAAPFHEASSTTSQAALVRRTGRGAAAGAGRRARARAGTGLRAAGPAHHGAHGLPDPPPGLFLESGGRCADRRDPRLFENAELPPGCARRAQARAA